eukprot:COSAG03_NODE_2358_length_2849_cov_4798.631732_5_plen_170_part_01
MVDYSSVKFKRLTGLCSGDNPLFKHGFLRPHSSGRFLEHTDGTPFYWLGDTHWSGFSTAEHWADSDNSTLDPGPSEHSMLKEIVDVRAAQGYSVWKGETFVVNGKQGGSAGSIANAGGSLSAQHSCPLGTQSSENPIGISYDSELVNLLRSQVPLGAKVACTVNSGPSSG